MNEAETRAEHIDPDAAGIFKDEDDLRLLHGAKPVDDNVEAADSGGARKASIGEE